MQLVLEVIPRADGRLALFHGDRLVGHAPPAWAELLLSGEPTTPAGESPTPARGRPKGSRTRTRTAASTPVTRAATKRAARPARSRRGPEPDRAAIARAQQLADQGQSLAEIRDSTGLKYGTLWEWKKRGWLTVTTPSRKGPAPKPGARPTPRRTASTPRRPGPTLATLDTDAPPTRPLRRCPACGAMTAARYCPNGHDIYLDADLHDEPTGARAVPLLDDEADDDD